MCSNQRSHFLKLAQNCPSSAFGTIAPVRHGKAKQLGPSSSILVSNSWLWNSRNRLGRTSWTQVSCRMIANDSQCPIGLTASLSLKIDLWAVFKGKLDPTHFYSYLDKAYSNYSSPTEAHTGYSTYWSTCKRVRTRSEGFGNNRSGFQ